MKNLIIIGTSTTGKKIYEFVNQNFDFSVKNIIEELNLKNPIYYNVASYGHFGRTDINLPWEQTKRIQF